MTTSNYITQTELREELQEALKEALKPVTDRLDRHGLAALGIPKAVTKNSPAKLGGAVDMGQLTLGWVQLEAHHPRIVKHVRGRTNQIYDALEKHGLPMAKEGDDG